MKRDELRAAYKRLQEFIDRNTPTHSEQAAIMADLRTLGEFVGLELEIRQGQPEQAALIEVPQARRGGY